MECGEFSFAWFAWFEERDAWQQVSITVTKYMVIVQFLNGRMLLLLLLLLLLVVVLLLLSSSFGLSGWKGCNGAHASGDSSLQMEGAALLGACSTLLEAAADRLSRRTRAKEDGKLNYKSRLPASQPRLPLALIVVANLSSVSRLALAE